MLDLSGNEAEDRVLSLNHDPRSPRGRSTNILRYYASSYQNCCNRRRVSLVNKFMKSKIVMNIVGKSFRHILKEQSHKIFSSGILNYCVEAEESLTEIALNDLGSVPYSPMLTIHEE